MFESFAEGRMPTDLEAHAQKAHQARAALSRIHLLLVLYLEVQNLLVSSPIVPGIAPCAVVGPMTCATTFVAVSSSSRFTFTR